MSHAELAAHVHQRAGYRCEYCQTAQVLMGQALHIEHIQPNGDDSLDNLCSACANCNLSKARATSAVDPQTNVIVPLFNPRTQRWSDHFVWRTDGLVVIGLTPTGRATIERLKMNRLRIIEARSYWILTGKHPPS